MPRQPPCAVAAHWAGRQPGDLLRSETAGVLVAAPLGLALVTSYLTAVSILIVTAYALNSVWNHGVSLRLHGTFCADV
jgi:hypothetical protein